ncbi:hypothetical protein GCM10009867_16490 [Pedococcus aerophilus]|uniref:Ribosomally synthesized peptide with SipW-like signal peptide n=1 Tax=Pedococcus aerophilus TaxID=436356 RepID=A0ABN3UL89_9MICO
MAHLSRRQKFAASATALVLIGSGTAAFAYWTSTGSGTGTANTTAGAADIRITGDISTALFPGQAAQDFTVTVKNWAENSAYVNTVSAYVTTDKGAACDGSNFTINNVSAATAAPIVWTAADLTSGQAVATANTIQFVNKATDQDGCKGAALTLHYASN